MSSARASAEGPRQRPRCSVCLWDRNKRHTVPCISVRSDPRVSVYKVERVMTKGTPDSMVFFGQVWEVTTSSSAGRPSGNEHRNSDSWGHLSSSRGLREPTVPATQTLVCISSFPGLDSSHGKNKPSLTTHSASLRYLPPSIQPALRPASNACTEQYKKMSPSSLKWHKIAKTTRWGRWWSCLKRELQ